MSGDDRNVIMSGKGFSELVKPEKGKNFHWTCDVNVELPVKVRTNGFASVQPKTLPQQFYEIAQKYPNNDALLVQRNGGKTYKWSWFEYYTQSVQFARSLVKLGATERKAVNIMAFNAPEWAIAFQGSVLANMVCSGIYTTNTPDAVQYQANHSECQVGVVDTIEQIKKFLAVWSEIPDMKAIVYWGQEKLPEDMAKDTRIHTWENFMKLGQSVQEDVVYALAQKQKPGQCCCLIYTSGTTGRPKGVMLSHDNLLWCSYAQLQYLSEDGSLEFSEDAKVLSYLPLSHIAGFAFDIINQMIAGTKLYFAMPDALQGTLVQSLQWCRPSAFMSVPRLWEKFEDKLKEIGAQSPAVMQNISGWAKGHGYANTMAKMNNESPPLMYPLAKKIVLNKIHKALGLDEAQQFFYGAAPLKKSSVEYFASLDMPIYNIYGMSETTGATTLHRSTNFSLVGAGTTMPGCDIKISNPDEKGVGEICMRGRNTMMGYLKNEASTIDTLDEFGYVKSGDIGKFDERGFLRITGRIKELIITAGGENIAPVPIEDNFKKIAPIVSNVMLVGEMQRFMGALITIKADIDLNTGVPSNKLAPEAKAFLKSELKLDLNTTDEACANKDVQKYIQKCIEETNKLSVSRAAHIRKFKLLPIDFSIPGGELTPTLKLKRKVTEKKYQQFVDEIFAAEAKL